MSKLAPTSIKYVIKAQINARGVIEKPDVIGAIFGQTEGLLGPDLDLRELQRTGRIGRIEVNIHSEKGKSYGEIIIPSSLDSAETALIAASLETVERVGPCIAKITVKSVEDIRAMKRKFVIDRAKSILKDLMERGMPDVTKIADDIKEEVKTFEITKYQGLTCGPALLDSDEIIVVEGRADVINLVKHGIKNVIAIEGSNVPDPVVQLTKEKITTAFLDGDRGGSLNLKKLLETADIDYVVFAPQGKEVEELSKKEIYKALRDKISASQFRLEEPNNYNHIHEEAVNADTDLEKTTKPLSSKKHRVEITKEQRDMFKKTLEDLIGTRAACIFDSSLNLLGKVPVKELMNTLKTIENPYVVIFDGKIDYRLHSLAKRKGVKFLVGMKMDTDMKKNEYVLCKDDL